MIRELIDTPLEPGTFWNVNLPHPEPEAVEPEVVFCPLDPSRFSSEFWTSVADRVRAGSLGLMLVPDYAYGQAMAEIPALQSVSPIAKARAVAPIVAGGPIAGVYPNPHPILLAADAVEHPAARIVPFKRWNASWWDSLGRGDAKAAWTTKFCSPIESLVPGSVVLARLSAGMDTAPALVATSGEARVLWVGGFFDLETLAYKDSRSVLAFRTLLHAWMFWLAPPKS